MPDDPRQYDSRLSALFQYRWTTPVLAELHRSDNAARGVVLRKRLDVDRETLRRALRDLIDRGWVEPNPGHGHPLRPEYLLTATGLQLAPWCDRYVRAVKKLEVFDIGLRKWSFRVTAAVGQGYARFSEIRSAIPKVTARSLTLCLKQLQEHALVDRVVYDDYPPQVEYRLGRSGDRLVTLLPELPNVDVSM